MSGYLYALKALPSGLADVTLPTRGLANPIAGLEVSEKIKLSNHVTGKAQRLA